MGLCCTYGTKCDGETQSEYNERVRSHFIVFYTQFNVVISYSTILISIWPYLNKIDPLAGPTYLGYLISASALGQTLFSPAIGYWSNYLNSARVPFIASLIVFLLSHLIYACLELFHPITRKYWMLFSRLLAGVGSCNFALCRAHVSTTTLQRERRKVVTLLSSCATVSFALGPAIQSCVLPLGEDGFSIVPGKLSLNMFTAVGWIGVLLTAANLALFAPAVFKEHTMSQREEPAKRNEDKNNLSLRNYKLLALLFILLNFTLTFNMMFLKILGTPLVMIEFAMSRSQAIALNSIVVTVGAAISAVSILLINPICKFITEMKLLIFALLVTVVGRLSLYSFSPDSIPAYNKIDVLSNESNQLLGCTQNHAWCASETKIFYFQFILGNTLENVGYAIAITLTMTIFSRVLTDKKQGAWMGFLTAFGGIARMVSPVFITTLYESYGPSVAVLVTNLLFAAICAFLIKMTHYCLIHSNTNAKADVEDKLMQSERKQQGQQRNASTNILETDKDLESLQ